jgi:hypothetical protein
MTKRASKTILTISFLLVLLGVVIVRTKGWYPVPWSDLRIFQPSLDPSPEAAIYAMLDAARAGDTKAYLNAFSGPMRDQLVQIVSENTEPKFAAYLTTQNASFQGVAVAVTDRSSGTEAQARLEYVYTNRNEIQNIFLHKEQGRWKILRVAGAERIKTLIPFGTAATD